MGFFDFLFGRTPRATDDVPDFDVTVGNVVLNRETLGPQAYHEIKRQMALHGHVDLTITLPDEDDPTPEDDGKDTPARPGYVPVEPVFCTIDYTDASGNPSRRRITIRSVSCQGERSILAAVCHERRALRHFRLDRISRVVTFDGEIFSAAAFVADLLGIDVNQDHSGNLTRPDMRPANFRTLTKHAVILLVAIAIADDHLHPEEVEKILCYLEDEAFALDRAGRIDAFPEVEVFDVIRRRIGRIRPTREDLAEACHTLRNRPADEIDRLKRAIAQVITADGEVLIEEEMILNELDQFLGRSDTTAWAELDRLVSMT